MSRFIYFISSGTNSNDIGKSGKNNLSYFGYKQLCKLRENDYFKTNILSKNIEILTSSDRNCVESSLILFSDITQKTVNVVSYLSNKRDKNTNHTQFFKRNLVNDGKKHYLETLDFGMNHILQTLIKQFPQINADLKTNGKNYYFNASKFTTLLEHKINTSPGIIVVLCDSVVIRAMLSKLSSSKYRQIKHESFEKSSVWEVQFNFDSTGKIIYDLFSKKYPTEKNYEPLEHKGNKFLCELKGIYIPLFEKSSDVSDNLLKKISSSSISKNNIQKMNSFQNNEEEEEYTTNKKSRNSFNTISNYQ
jgi:hypothetical protein